MDFAFSEEQEQLRKWAGQFLAERYDAARLVEIADSERGYDPDVWPRLAEMGWLDDELTFLDHAVLFEETGTALLPAPYLTTVALAGPALRAAGEDLSRPATLAWAEPGVPQGLLDVDGLTVHASDRRIEGRKVLVPDAGAADLFVVVASGPAGPGLYAVDAGASIQARETLDGTRRLADVRFDNAPARVLVEGERAREVVAETRRWAFAALACEAVGVAGRVLDMAVEHARTREQFGRPIGVHQAVSHRLSDTYMALQGARSLAYWAAWCVTEGDPRAEQACLAAKALAGDAAVAACESAIQVHGGIGMTWEHPLHRYYRRAQWIAAFDGASRTQRAEVAAALLD
ncbi:MAG: acyl-CoA dehydrogenase family protein [Streptosporangiaceae bacterium]